MFISSLSKYIPGKTIQLPAIVNRKNIHKTNGVSVFLIASLSYFFAIYYQIWPYNIVFTNFGAFFQSLNLLCILLPLFFYIQNLLSTTKKTTIVISKQNSNKLEKVFNEITTTETSFIQEIFYGRNECQIFGIPLSGLVITRTTNIFYFYLLLSLSFQQHYQLTRIDHYPSPPLFFGTPLVVYLILIFTQLMDYLINESHELTSSSFASQSFGFLSFWKNLMFKPLLKSVSIFPLVVVSTFETISPLLIIFIVLGFFIGLFISRDAKRQRFEYVMYGSKAIIWGDRPHIIESKNVNSGKKPILVSGWWGIVRHPSLFGDYLMLFSLSFLWLVNVNYSYYFLLYFFMLILLLVFEVQWEEKQSIKKFEEVWRGYSTYVPYKIIPHLF